MDQANDLECYYLSKGKIKKNKKNNKRQIDIFDNPNPLVIKTHNYIDTKFKKTLWVFTTANKTRDRLELEQYNVKHVQDLNLLSAAPENGGGVENYILNYATNMFGLPAEKTKFIMDFMRYWDVLRRCCGTQMSKTWREELILKGVQPNTNNYDTANLYDLNTVHECSAYNIDSVEQLFMNTTLYQQISSEFPLIIHMLKTSNRDRDLFGTYCSQYNQHVSSEHLRFNEKGLDRYKSLGGNNSTKTTNNNATDGATKETTVDGTEDDNNGQGEDVKETHKDGAKVLTDDVTEDSVEALTKSADGTLPDHDIPAHIMQMGPSRTATTLQFQLVCLCQLLQLIHNGRMDQANDLECYYLSKGKIKKNKKNNKRQIDIFDNPNPLVIKTHNYIDTKFKKTLWVFTTANKTRDRLELEQYNVKHVQDLNLLSAAPENGGGVENYILNYATNMFGLPAEKTKFIMDFMRYWDVLRRCCGTQMSKTWREELILKGVQPNTNNYDTANLYDLNTVHECSAYNIDSVEQLFMNTTLYQQISSEFPLIIHMLKTSNRDRDLFGTYCSQYNQHVSSEHLRFNEKR